jgi:hypothetical protein
VRYAPRKERERTGSKDQMFATNIDGYLSIEHVDCLVCAVMDVRWCRRHGMQDRFNDGESLADFSGAALKAKRLPRTHQASPALGSIAYGPACVLHEFETRLPLCHRLCDAPEARCWERPQYT